MTGIERKVVAITGASSGIAEATVLRAPPATVVLLAVRVGCADSGMSGRPGGLNLDRLAFA
jgi:NAD(P)-dependent dehydrogenase (short-subunit alcohol dehydrogenase family)